MPEYWPTRQRILREKGAPAAAEPRPPASVHAQERRPSVPPPSLPSVPPRRPSAPPPPASAWDGAQWLDLWASASAEGPDRFVDLARELASPHGFSVHRYRRLSIFVKGRQAVVLPLPGALPGDSTQVRLWFDWPDRPRTPEAWILKQEATAEIPADLNISGDRDVEKLANLTSGFIRRGEIRNA